MGSLPADTRCGWCGRTGAGYIPDGISPPVPLCGWAPLPPPRDGGCLFGTRTREMVMADALSTIVRPSTVNLFVLVVSQPDLNKRIAEML